MVEPRSARERLCGRVMIRFITIPSLVTDCAPSVPGRVPGRSALWCGGAVVRVVRWCGGRWSVRAGRCGQRRPMRCSRASWSRASIPTLRRARPSTSYVAARRSASDSPSARVGVLQGRHLGGLERGLHGGVGAERLHPLAQHEVVAHARLRGVPDAVHRLGARRLVVEVDVAVVGVGGPGAEEGVDGPEGAAQVARTEPQVLVEARSVLPVEVDVEELVVPQGLADPVGEVEPGHLLVPDLGVEPDHPRLVELGDQRERVADGRQQDVAAGLVGLGLEGEADVVATVLDVGAEQVERLRVAVERRLDVLRWHRARHPRARPTGRTSWHRGRRRGPRCAAPWPARGDAPRGCWPSAPPSLKTGWLKRLVVTISTARPVSDRAFSKRASVASRSPSSGSRSSSWKVTAAAPISASW